MGKKKNSLIISNLVDVNADEADFDAAVGTFEKDVGIKDGDIVLTSLLCVKSKDGPSKKVLHTVTCLYPMAKWNFSKQVRAFIHSLPTTSNLKK